MSVSLTDMFRRLEALRQKQAEEAAERDGLREGLPQDRPLWRLFRRYYLGRHLGTVLFVIIVTCLPGLVMYGYALAGRFIADEIVQISLMDESAIFGGHDPTRMGEHRLFGDPQILGTTGLDQRLAERPGRTVPEKLRLLGWLALALVSMELLRHGLSAVLTATTIGLTQKITFRLRQHLHDKLHALSMPYHDTHSPGRLMTHLFSDMSVIQNHVTNLLRNVPASIAAIAVGLALVLHLDWSLGLLVAATVPTYAIAYQWFSRYLVAINRDLREREGELNGHIANRISHFVVVKSYTREIREGIDFLHRARPILMQNISAALFNTGFAVVCGIITASIMTTVLWLGALRCRDGLWSPGQLLMFYGSTGYLFTPVTTLAAQASLLHRLRAVAGKVMRVLEQPIDLTDPEEPVSAPLRACEIRFEHVSLQYANTTSPVIKDVSFTVPAGKRLCIMGASGSGKSTIAKLACRLYDPTEGVIRFDGHDIRSFRIADFRRLVGFVNQEPIVFSGTIGENIRYGAEHARAGSVVAAAQYAQIHDYIEKLPAQYRSLTHERGLTLSGGQKQRVNLARALLQNPQVLVLDDCTSALDADTEARLIQALREVLMHRTAILVSHRVSVALACDLVLMLDHGQVAQFGDPSRLLQEPGPFHELYRQQYQKAQDAEKRHREPAVAGV